MNSYLLKKFGYLLIGIFTALLFFHPVMYNDKTFYFRDIHRFFYPMKFFLAVSLKSGNLPFWWPNNFCGEPFMSFIQSGVFYPPSILFVILPFPLSLNFYIIVHFLIGFCFFYLFVIALGLSRKSAIITGISFCYGGFAIATVNVMNNLSTLVWLPAVLWSFHQFVIGGKPSHFVGTILWLSMGILGGEPQLFVMIAATTAILGLIWIVNHPVSRGRFALIAIIPVTAIGITMVQLGPSFNDYLHSIRLGGLSYKGATEYSLDLSMVKHLFIPLVFPPDFTTNPKSLTDFFPGRDGIPWLLTVYPGFMIVPAAFLGVCLDFSRKHIVWIGIFAVGMTLSLGYHTPVYHLFYTVFPFFRYPEKFMLLAGFGLLILAAYGLDSLFRRVRRTGSSTRALFITLALVITSDLYIAHAHLNPICDTAFYSHHHKELDPVFQDPDMFRVYIDKRITTGENNQKTIQSTHIVWQLFQMPNLGVINQISHVNGETGLELGYQYLITELLLKPWEQKIDFLRLSNTKYIVTPDHLDQIPTLSGTLEKINTLVYRLKDPMPRAWLVGNLDRIQRPLLEELSGLSFDPKGTALAQGRIVESYQKPYYKRVQRVEYKENGSVIIDTIADERAVLILAESSYPGWRVWVNGAEKPGFKANFFYQAVELEKGPNRVEFVYRPENFNAFLSISSISLVLLLSGLAGFIGINFKKRAGRKGKDQHDRRQLP